jgi:hypothetical protein
MSAYLKAFSNKVIDNHALDGRELPKKLKILNWGLNETNDGNVYLTEYSVKVFSDYQKRAGRDKSLAIDFDHCTVKDSKEYVPGQPKAIAGYGDPVIVEGDGLYLYNVEWTPLGKKDARNYKDLSPAAVLDRNGVVLGLDSVALTPHGAVRDLNFFASKGFDETMLKSMSTSEKKLVIKDAKVDAEYNKKNANPAVRLTPAGPELVERVEDADADADAAISDEEALKKTKELEEHEKSEIKTKDADANADGALPNVKGTHIFEGDADADSDEDMDYDDEEKHTKGCMCARCMTAKHEEFASEDHYGKYGDVKYADPENHKYPIDNEKHVRAAWSYINMPKNAAKYESGKLLTIKSHIRSAAKKHGISIAEEKTKTKSMSASNPSFPDAYKAQPQQYNTMNDTILKKMAA